MKYTMPLAMVVIMICLASNANAAGNSDACNKKLNHLMTGMHQLENGLLFYFENVNLKTTEAAMRSIEEFYKNVNEVEQQCSTSVAVQTESCTNDVFCTTNAKKCLRDMTVLRWEVHVAFRAIQGATLTQSAINDQSNFVREHSSEQQLVWRVRRNVLAVMENMFSSNCQFFSQCQASQDGLRQARHNFLHARSMRDRATLSSLIEKLQSNTHNQVKDCPYIYHDNNGEGTLAHPTTTAGACKTGLDSVSALWKTLNTFLSNYGKQWWSQDTADYSYDWDEFKRNAFWTEFDRQADRAVEQTDLELYQSCVRNTIQTTDVLPHSI